MASVKDALNLKLAKAAKKSDEILNELFSAIKVNWVSLFFTFMTFGGIAICFFPDFSQQDFLGIEEKFSISQSLGVLCAEPEIDCWL